MDNKLKTINFLGKNMQKRFTMHNLSKLLAIPYASFYRTVEEMKDLLVIEQVGRAKAVSLNLNGQTLKSHLAIASEDEKKEYLEKEPVIRKIANELETDDIVVLFGSYADRTYTARSDIDILVINKEGNKSVSFSKYELLFKKKINPVFVTKKEFQLMLGQEDENLGKQAVQKHIILNNPERFWECVLYAV